MIGPLGVDDRAMSARWFHDLLVQAVLSARDNRVRAILTILGISVGISAVITVGAISKGGQLLIMSELETFGLRSVWVRRDLDDSDPNRQATPGTGIDTSDYRILMKSCCRDVANFSPVVLPDHSLAIHSGNSYSNAHIKGVAASYASVANLTVVEGHFLRKRDIEQNRLVAVIGPTVAASLFGTTFNAVGKEFRLGEHKFVVIGVLESISRDFLASIGSASEGTNNAIFVPFAFVQRVNGNTEINYLHVEVTRSDTANEVGSEITSLLERLHKGRYTYTHQSMSTHIETANRILGAVSLIGVVAASISLLVGGLGIMNMMGTSVLERTREIGLRKALGARSMDILVQFLLEAVLLSVAGGVVGLLAGIGIVAVLATVSGLTLLPSIGNILQAIIVAALVGIASGMVPARRAANLAPVVALRHE